MKVTLNPVILAATGSLGKYYIRILNGQPIMQRKPGSDGHVISEKQQLCRQRFAQQYAGKH